MEEVRQLVQEEGREARNLVAFHVAVDTPGRVARKPPRAIAPPPRRAPPRPASRLRSASAGRDKRSELRARYWALLFGDLQRAVGEIYNTVEANENQNECQEVILVLENYTRDFKALGEWFRLKWDYDNTPPPQRPQSLAWEIRKTDFVRPESRRTYSVKSSPSVSGKNSPCLSGYNTPNGKHSPNLTGKASPSGKVSPRISAHSSTNSSPKANVEFFSTKIVSSKCTAKPEPKAAKEVPRLSEIKEKDVKECTEEQAISVVKPDIQIPLIEIGKAKEYPNISPKPVIVKSQKSSKLLSEKVNKVSTIEEISNSVKIITDKLDVMENEFLAKQISDNTASNENWMNVEKECEEKKVDMKSSDNCLEENDVPKEKHTESLTESEDNFADVSNESSNKSQFVGEHFKDNLVTAEENSVHFTEKEVYDYDTENNEKEYENSFVGLEKRERTNEVTLKTQRNMANDVENESKKPEINANHETKNEEVKIEDNLEKINDAHGMQKHEPQVIHSAFEIKELEIESSEVDTINVGTEDKHEPKSEAKLVEDESTKIESQLVENETKKSETKGSAETKPLRPAYSQAAAKPKPINAIKSESKILTTRSTTPIARSRTVVELKPNIVPRTQKQFLKRSQPNKCSYPFNLTTGRTTLFDASSSNIASRGNLTKKPINRNVSTGSGDTKPVQKKVDVNKMPLRPTTLKINEKGDKKDQLNATLAKIKDCEEYSSTDTIVTQIDMFRIESNESLKTLVPEELQMINDVTNSIEVLNVDSNKSDNEGWLTVKSRRFSRESKKQSRSHWANRFHQPSATTSLPILNMMESPKQETKPIVCNSENERAKSEQPQNINQVEKSAKIVKVATKTKSESKAKNAAIIRQKSDVTGLKTRSARNKARAEKAKDSRKQDGTSELTKNRLHSSLESLTMGLARSQESTEGVFDFDKWKAEFKTKFKYLDDDDQVPNDTEILKTADPSEMSEIAEMTSQIEENERKLGWALDFQSEVDQRKLCEEEDLLNRQIMELQQVSDIDMDTETDETETDAEIVNEENSKAAPSCSKPDAVSLEDQYGTALAAMSLAERMDTLVVLEELVARDPGRAQQLHAKLSQGIKRRGSLQDAVRRLHAKQARAERQRRDYQTERTKKIHQLLARVEEVKIAKNQVIEEKRLRMERRLQKAAENRHQYLKDKVRKAHDEEEKLKEIAFIKQLEAENKSIEFFDICRSHTARLRQMRRDRLMKLEQKAARDAAVGARRQALEEARRLHVETLLEKKKERDARVDHLNQLKKQERDDAAREKAEGVKSRLSALAAAAELEADALRSRIRDKQDASQQRLESHLQAIREKATGPRQATTSESQDQATKELEEEVERLEQEKKERDRQRAVKKRARKFKQKLLLAGNHSLIFNEHAIASETFLNPVAIKMSKVISHIKNIISPLVEILNKDNEEKAHEKSPIDDDVEKNNKKNTDNTVNGNTELQENSGARKKSKKKKTAEENPDIVKENIQKDKIVENNNTSDTKIIEIETKPVVINPNDQPKTENTKKKNKKNKNKELTDVNNENKIDKPKLSKASSICSSISDTSKASTKAEKQANLIDVPMLERQLNELYRLVERFGKNAADKTTFQKLQGLKTLGQLLAIVAEREDLATQFTPKSLTTAVNIMSAWVGSCCGSAAYLVSTNTCVHAIKLLSDQLEKDLQSDFREMELTKHLGDFLSLAFDSVLCSTRLYEEGKEKTGRVEGDLELLTVLRARAHSLISYLCLIGCVGRAERAGEARESVQTLLTVCADLCHPCEADGTERSTAQQSLRCALGTSLCGSRAEFCMLFAKGAGLEECGGFVRAARTTHLLRALAEMDHHIVQEAFGEGGWQLEFRAAVARLLSQHAPSEKEAPRTTALKLCNVRLDKSLSETMVLDLIVLIGFVVVNNPQLQETICDGWSVNKILCSLPANWLVSKPHSHALLPTLAALSELPESPVRAAIASEINLKLIEDFLEHPEAQKVKLVQVIKQERCKRTSSKSNAKKNINRKK